MRCKACRECDCAVRNDAHKSLDTGTNRERARVRTRYGWSWGSCVPTSVRWPDTITEMQTENYNLNCFRERESECMLLCHNIYIVVTHFGEKKTANLDTLVKSHDET